MFGKKKSKDKDKVKKKDDKKKSKGKDKDKSKTSKTESKSPRPDSSSFSAIADNFETFEDIQAALRKEGLESCNLIIGVDFTLSNTYQGEKTFGGKCLHYIPTDGTLNPYQTVISAISQTLSEFDEDKLIHAYFFGDVTTKAERATPFRPDGLPCNGFPEVIQLYNSLAQNVQMSGPTSFAAVIRAAIDVVKKDKGYHILIIIADGKVDRVDETRKAIVEACDYPMSIVTVGVGDGPWDIMEEFDDGLPERKFDNFQFVDFGKIAKQTAGASFNTMLVRFATAAMMEIPEQLHAIKKLQLL
jgi:hypothetical protein